MFGAAVGAGVGVAIGLVGGPFGLAPGASVGAAVGGTVGALGGGLGGKCRRESKNKYVPHNPQPLPPCTVTPVILLFHTFECIEP